MKTLVLASQSPRRRFLLEKAGYQFHTLSIEISEKLKENLSLDEALQDLARQKSEALLESGKLLNLHDILLLSSDTVVVLDGEVIGKPKDLVEAENILGRMSGRTHKVKTAICLMELSASGQEVLTSVTALETSEVTFKAMSSSEITRYVQTQRPLDKAGAYGIQDLPEGVITHLKGNLDNVMGLPVKLVEELLTKNGWDVARRGN